MKSTPLLFTAETKAGVWRRARNIYLKPSKMEVSPGYSMIRTVERFYSCHQQEPSWVQYHIFSWNTIKEKSKQNYMGFSRIHRMQIHDVASDIKIFHTKILHLNPAILGVDVIFTAINPVYFYEEKKNNSLFYFLIVLSCLDLTRNTLL